MKTKLLLLLMLIGAGTQAQTNHVINWFMGVTPTEASIIIAPGDTVTWLWTDDLPHTVTSTGTSVENFNSGMISEEGSTYEREFNTIGQSTYRCNFHPMMTGMIDVQSLSVIDNAQRSFSMYPNPVNDVLTIEGGETLENITIVNAAGKVVLDLKSNTPEAKIYMSNYPSGNYFIKVQTAGKIKTMQVLKK
jgi:plastocyanin